MTKFSQKWGIKCPDTNFCEIDWFTKYYRVWAWLSPTIHFPSEKKIGRVFEYFCRLRTLTGKKAPSNETTVLTKSRNMGI